MSSYFLFSRSRLYFSFDFGINVRRGEEGTPTSPSLLTVHPGNGDSLNPNPKSRLPFCSLFRTPNGVLTITLTLWSCFVLRCFPTSLIFFYVEEWSCPPSYVEKRENLYWLLKEDFLLCNVNSKRIRIIKILKRRKSHRKVGHMEMGRNIVDLKVY